MPSKANAWETLRARFSWEEIEIKPLKVSPEKGKALAVPYFNARAVQRRLDDAFGPENWSTTYREVSLVGKAVGIICRLEIFVRANAGERVIVREEVCEPSQIEPLKGAASGALKRAFSALGCRYLYEVDFGWQEAEFYRDKNGKDQFRKWTDRAMLQMRQIYEANTELYATDEELPSEPEAVPGAAPATAAEIALIDEWIRKCGLPVKEMLPGYELELCKMIGTSSPRELSQSDVRQIGKCLREMLDGKIPWPDGWVPVQTPE